MNHIFVTIEGIDGAGKTTVIEGLKDEYPDAEFTTEPNDDDWVGKAVRRAIGGDETPALTDFHLFLADHHKHVEDVVRPALDDNRLVVCDRYLDSRYAYQQIALDGIVDGDTLDWIREVQEGGSTILPDLTLLLDISVDESFRRKEGDDKEKFEKRGFLTQVRENYHELAEVYPDRYVIVDGEQPPEDVVSECLDIVRDRMDS